MELLTEKRENNEFLSCRITENELDEFACQMFGANDIPVLIPFSIAHRDADVWLEYNISGLKTIELLATDIITRKRLISILSGFINAFIEIEDYMLEMDKVILDSEHVYYNRISESLKLIYLPITTPIDGLQNSMSYLAELLGKLRFDARDRELENAVKSIINEIEEGNITEIIGLKDLQSKLNLIEEIAPAEENAKYFEKEVVKDDHNISEPVQQEESISASAVTKEEKKNRFGFSIPGIDEIPVIKKPSDMGGKKDSVSSENDNAPKLVVKKKLSFAIPGLSRKEEPAPVNEHVDNPKPHYRTLDVDEEDETDTTVMKGQTAISSFAKLYRISDGATFMIMKDSYLLGRSQSCDCCIDNPQISRIHAKIENLNGVYYITDQNSSNRTYVDGIIAKPDKRIKLNDGSKIKLYNELFVFNN